MSLSKFLMDPTLFFGPGHVRFSRGLRLQFIIIFVIYNLTNWFDQQE